ncbi:sigma-54-dependent Fis family transcriptional regulator [Sporomusa sphaeroides]|uniref:Acetoin dehydrogenase operon transcriptional activator AcoR n=2 Tax=Sporomusa TaxID=2375 RepID=A0ABM9W622_9FIRM|nr:sigma-54-dependent Fis family transcriptional regulator [Sporomusa sphaeroides]OLS57699.1 acetoin dehydrogenase operon transcriptional activator AcoR [Sporomusa sphaeroides DSM 2875]CVK20604.1 Acetoin dehydrogenase operon transcriptional activator AcoR [Sporomusa sphaeroides DSM 2875]SCM80934.1 Signal-transduction and transcriptional-control protein [uncultured Sporomusa sp.]
MVVYAENTCDGTLAGWLSFTATLKSIDKSYKHSIRPEILDSWVRCRQARVNPNDDGVHHQLDQYSLRAVLRENQELITIAKPFMDNLYQIVAGSGFVVVLTDIRGYIMEILGDKDTLKNPMTVSFFQGANWSEKEAGTNAIGTALVTRKPIQVSGSEHYCRKHHCLTCSAAPILDEKGKVLGILDVSGKSTAAHLHTLGMVVAATEAIMAQLAIRRKNNELRVMNSRLTNIFNTMSDGVIMIDNNGVISELNPVAKKILGFGPTKFETKQPLQVESIFGAQSTIIRRIITCKESCADIEIMLDTNCGLSHYLATGEPVADEQGVVTGGVIILRPMKQIQNLVNRFSGHYGTLKFSDIIGESKAILEAVRIASLAATCISSVLLQGESGTGKEIFAQAIHNRSDRSAGPFIAVNCGAIPRELIGSELFGYEDGAFTGAKRGGKPGKFELACGGTLFLDEIGDMPLEQQVALLRVLQERKVNRIGSDKVIPVDVRVICATNKSLLKEVEKGTFRKDLYYRLNVIAITIPPLRERSEDIVPLFNYFLDRLDKHGRNFRVSPAVIERIVQYDWPGNVRELQNVVERIVSLTEGEMVNLINLPKEICTWQPTNPTSPNPDNGNGFYPARHVVEVCRGREGRRFLLEENERQEILSLLSAHRGNVSLTARTMGVSRNTLYRKMKQYAIYN